MILDSEVRLGLTLGLLKYGDLLEDLVSTVKCSLMLCSTPGSSSAD